MHFYKAALFQVVVPFLCCWPDLVFGQEISKRSFESLDRGIIALERAENEVAVSWRFLTFDNENIAFNCYRKSKNKIEKLNSTPIINATFFIDDNCDRSIQSSYFVRAVVNGIEQSPSKSFELPARADEAEANPYVSIPLQTPDRYRPNDASVGDLDGDGRYEIVLHQVGRGRDNSQRGRTTEPILEAYTLDGKMLWRINLGKNIREGAHYTQFMVYDLDGDGKAEVACKTADGTVDGQGRVIGDPEADYRNRNGYILEGPEYFTIFDGMTGAALATTDYVPQRGNVKDWGDDYGNRVDRFLACVAYLDGKRPSVVMCRGYYTRCVLAAWNWRDNKLTNVWCFDSDDGTPGNRKYRGQGNHGIAVGDVDNDGKDEIIYGSCVIDDDGSGLYSTGLGHGDAMHVTDHDPDRPGLEVFKANGDTRSPAGIQMRDAKTGEQLWGIPSTGREGVVRACAFDIDPRHPGSEAWGFGRGVNGLYNAKGEKISDWSPRSCNMAIWWDGDVQRELLDGTRITKWDYKQSRERRLFDARQFGCVSINGSKSNPCLCADILGDWREEIIVPTFDGKELRIFCTTIPTKRRFVTFMHDPIYRLSVAWQNVSYNQPAHPGFYLGD